ncbi:MAG TPA: hypothetical protein ENJ57_04810 [Rhizobiales bacterium]|nr:hypothetical protein [Hyphomicrobiales bacterium]
MAHTREDTRRGVQLSMICAALAVAGLVAGSTPVDAKATKRVYNKDEFVLLCNSQDLKILCDERNRVCSCDDEETRFVWRLPRDQGFNAPPDPSHAPPVGGDGDDGRERRGGN